MGARTPPGRVDSPQVLATSTMAVSSSNAITVLWFCPVAPCTVTGKGWNPLANAAATLPSPPSASGRVLQCGTCLGEAFRQVVGDLGGGEAAFELVGCDQDSHGCSFF